MSSKTRTEGVMAFPEKSVIVFVPRSSDRSYAVFEDADLRASGDVVQRVLVPRLERVCLVEAHPSGRLRH